MRIFSKSKILAGILVVALCLSFSSFVVFAAESDTADSAEAPEGSTILPGTQKSVATCEVIMRYVNYTPINEIKEKIAKKEEISIPNVGVAGDDMGPPEPVKYTDVLGCAIKTGDVKAWMIPFFIRYILEFIIGLAGLIAVGGIVYGGYLYLFAGLSDDKDKGKNAIKNGILGFIIVLTSWAIVNIVISLVTL